ncbi:MAG: PAS domain-containing protein [Proteobacteria bacterium]|nr:PAS domain-containing protein [Pseudomonadota bacterium]
MLDNDEKLSALILRIYDAALDDEQWALLIRDLTHLFNAEDSILFGSPDIGNDRMLVLSPMINADTNAPAAYESHFWKHDIWKASAAQYGFAHRGAIFHGDQFIERNAFQNTEIYCDFFKPMMNGTGVVLTAVIEEATQEQPMPLVLSFYKSLSAESFTQQDEQLIRKLMPHFQRSLAIRRRLLEEQQMRQLRELALDKSKDAIVLLDVTGQVLFVNQQAERLLRHGSLSIRNGRLNSPIPSERRALMTALLNAQEGIGGTLQFGGHNQITRMAMISPIPLARGELLEVSTRIMMIIYDPDRADPGGNIEVFARLYRLTAAEARILKNLLLQQSTAEIAQALHISIHTLRTHLKSLFAKTNTKNQRNLVNFCRSHPFI